MTQRKGRGRANYEERILSIFVLSPLTVSMVKFFVSSKRPKNITKAKRNIKVNNITQKLQNSKKQRKQ